MKNRSFRRWLTLVLVLAMLLGILPAGRTANGSRRNCVRPSSEYFALTSPSGTEVASSLASGLLRGA